MASISVSPTSVAQDRPFTITYSGGKEIVIRDSAGKDVKKFTRNNNNGSFSTSLAQTGAYKVIINPRSTVNKATANLTVTAFKPASIAVVGPVQEDVAFTVNYDGGSDYPGAKSIVFRNKTAGTNSAPVNKSTASGSFQHTLADAAEYRARLLSSSILIASHDFVALATEDTGEGDPWEPGTRGATGVPALEYYLKPGYEMIALNQQFVGYGGPAKFECDGGLWADATVQKVVAGCSFEDSPFSGFLLKNVRNLLIYDCVPDNVRTHQVQDGVHFIAGAGFTEDVTIAGCTIGPGGLGADFYQCGGTSNGDTGKTLIEYNTLEGPGPDNDWGENAIDIKGTRGPNTIRHNKMGLWYPCPNSSAPASTQRDCSGSRGAAIVIHEGSGSGAPHNVSVYDNEIYGDVVNGMNISDETGAATGIDIGTNIWRNHSQGAHLQNTAPSSSKIRIASTQDIDGTAAIVAGAATRY